ncbi:MAG: class I SAM-dependent methyltransferase [Myxococcales bacterium]|nr:class I SAM-dependent methyltransferase [Myxococcales bacterium]
MFKFEPSDTAEAPVISGFLEGDAGRLPVNVTFASRLSLYVAFASGPTPADLSVFNKLVLALKGGEVDLSSCRFHLEYTLRGYAGRLVFLEEVYDCHALVYEQKYVDLKNFFRNVALVLAQKEGIESEFKEYTLQVLYDLAVYKRFFNEQDRVLANEPAHVAEAAQASLLAGEGREFFHFMDELVVRRLGEVVHGFDRERHERHGYYLRRQVWELILASEFLKRTNLKPRGYSGDAETMEMLYENRFVGRYVFNKLLHKFPIEQPAAQAVRNRRKLIPELMRSVIARFRQGDAPFRFFSVAAGPACELQDVYLGPEDFELLECSLLDQDPHALQRARATIERIEAARDQRIRYKTYTDSVRTMLRDRSLSERLGRYHFIYSMGLFDYLTLPVARAILGRLYGLLVPGGAMVIGNYHVANPSRYYMEYWADWVLHYRTEADCLELASTLPGAKASITFEPTRSQMFMLVEKT